MIPRRLIRTVPEHTTADVERWWSAAVEICHGWDHVTLREPLDPADFPLTGHLWSLCQSGAQKAGLIRLEIVHRLGGVYIDSDVELYRPLDALLTLPAFAAWEDEDTVPDAMFGAEPEHPAVTAMLAEATHRLQSGVLDWRTGAGAWSTGPGVFTAVLPDRADVLLLPPGAFYPYHYSEKHRRHEDHRTAQPWCFAAHHWAGSWVPSPREATRTP